MICLEPQRLVRLSFPSFRTNLDSCNKTTAPSWYLLSLLYKSHSLIRHIQQGWNFLRPEFNEFVELLPAQQRVSETAWYTGTADAVYQNLDIIRHHAPKRVLILAGDLTEDRRLLAWCLGRFVAKFRKVLSQTDGQIGRAA